MIRPPFRAGAAALVVAATVILATACSATPEPEPTEDAAAPAPTADASSPEATVAPTTAPDDPTCDTLISPETIAAFEGVGWSAQEDPLWIGSQEITDGILCRWGDFSTASDHMQMFGWAPIGDDDAKALQKELVAGGWLEEESDQGVYITESHETAFQTDEDGYGLTYLFADGHVTFADTKQGLLLIEWPQG